MAKMATPGENTAGNDRNGWEAAAGLASDEEWYNDGGPGTMGTVGR
jgi:hypothetical protein